MAIYSKRHRPPPTELYYDFPEQVRRRLLSTLGDIVNGGSEYEIGSPHEFDGLLSKVRSRLLSEYGYLCRPSYEALRRSRIDILEHFFSCEDEQVLDFIEVCFQYGNRSLRKTGVSAVNSILRDENIGFELTPWDSSLDERLSPGIDRIAHTNDATVSFPQFVPIENLHVHKEIIKPTLDLLTSSRFAVANSEMLKAHGAYRAGEYATTITNCCSAFESTLKTICDNKGWQYSKKDSCGRLVEACGTRGLFPEFYAQLLTLTGTIRNRLGDAHGRGPTVEIQVDRAHAQHMLNLTSTHILLLVELADLD